MVVPLVAAAGVTAAAGLMQALMQQQQQKEAQEQAEKMAREQDARQRLAQAERDQLSTIQGMGQGEQSALGNLIAVLQRSAR
jgi:flagellar biosynthesis/type III secretory pathway protein FliH